MIKQVIKILSFDPGLTCTGWALSEYNIKTGMFHTTKRGKIEGKKALTKNRELLALYTKRLVQLDVLGESARDLMRFNPDYVAIEAAFHQPGRTSAYEALILCIHEIEKVVKQELNLPVFKIAPRNVKRVAAHTGNAGKQTVQEAIIGNTCITIKETKQNPLEKMVEHEADAIAVGYAFATDVLLAS